MSADVIGSRIRTRREGRGMSQSQLSDLAGCSKSAISGIEAGRSLPSLPLAARLAEALDTTIDEIARGDR